MAVGDVTERREKVSNCCCYKIHAELRCYCGSRASVRLYSPFLAPWLGKQTLCTISRASPLFRMREKHFGTGERTWSWKRRRHLERVVKSRMFRTWYERGINTSLSKPNELRTRKVSSYIRSQRPDNPCDNITHHTDTPWISQKGKSERATKDEDSQPRKNKKGGKDLLSEKPSTDGSLSRC